MVKDELRKATMMDQTALFNNLVGSSWGSCMRSGLAMLGMIPEERLRESMSKLRDEMVKDVALLTDKQADGALRFIQLLQRVLDLQEIRRELPMELIKIRLQSKET